MEALIIILIIIILFICLIFQINPLHIIGAIFVLIVSMAPQIIAFLIAILIFKACVL